MDKDIKKVGVQKIKAWAVVSAERNDMDMNPYTILSLEPEPDIDGNRYKVRCSCKVHEGWHYLDSLAVFEKREEAVSWSEHNPSFKLIPCTITLDTPVRSKGKKK